MFKRRKTILQDENANQQTSATGIEQINTKTEQLPLNIDTAIQYLYNFIEDENQETKDLFELAMQQEVNSDWDSKYKLPEPNVMAKFSNDVYDNYSKIANEAKISAESPWRLLYCAKGKIGILDGFYGELYFNTENHYFMLVVKGTSNVGNAWSDITNVFLGLKGGEIDSAFTFGEKVRKLMLKFKCKPMLLITGHSLGGYLAQIITYTINYWYIDKDGNVQSRERPTDDFGIYTMVFDSPAALKQICCLDLNDPIDLKRLELPIINFVKDVNKVNSISKVGHHLGLVVATEDFKNLEDVSRRIWSKWNPLSFHKMQNFTNIDTTKVVKLQHLPSKKVIEYRKKEIPSLFFSRENYERLYKYSFIASTSAELKDKLPKFKMTISCIFLEDENLSAEEFIPRAHQVLAHFKEALDSGIYDGKKIFDLAVYKMWIADMLEDAHDFRLNEKMKQKVEDWKDGTKIGGFESYEQMRFVGCLIHNSVEKAFHYDYKKFNRIDTAALNNFLSTTEVTLILIVEDSNQTVSHTERKNVKIVYLVIDDDAAEKMSLNHSELDENSKHQLEDTELDFMGNTLRALDVFGSQLLQELPIWSIINFHIAAPHTDEKCYSNQSISGRTLNKKFKNAIDFANDLIRTKQKFVIISSDAGMGKSTALKQIARTLRKKLPLFWIIYLNLFACQKEFSEIKDKLKSKKHAVRFVRNVALVNCKNIAISKKVFSRKMKDMNVIFLFDSLDEICPLHRDTVERLIEFLRETELQIVLTTRSHEGQSFVGAEIYEMQLFQTWIDVEKFVRNQFVFMKKPVPSDTHLWIRHHILKNEDMECTKVPLLLEMATSIAIYDINKVYQGYPEKSDIFNDFLNKSVEHTVEKKMKIDQNNASCQDTYDYMVQKYTKLIKVLAICAIFFEGGIAKEYQEKITNNGKLINRFVLAKLDKDYKHVNFLHKSYAEYLVARVFVEQLKSKKQTLAAHQLKSVLLNHEFQAIRKHICTILTVSSSVETTFAIDFIKVSANIFLILLIKEDCYALYMLFKDALRLAHDNFLITDNTGNSFKMLYLALEYASKEFVADLINDGAKIENILHEKFVLHMAIRQGFYGQVKDHFEVLKSDINIPDKLSKSPLIYATTNKSIDVVKLLIENGAEVNKVDEEGKSALYYAILVDCRKLVNLLIANDADITEAVKWTLELDRPDLYAVISNMISEELKSKNIQLALAAEAAMWCRLKKCKQFCELGANPAELDSNGQSSVHYVAATGSLECVQYFLGRSEGEQWINEGNVDGETPLMLALKNENEDIVEWLLEKKAKTSLIDKTGHTCLHYAAAHGNLSCIEIVLQTGEIDHAGNNGLTALFYATAMGQTHVLKYLLDRSANPAYINKRGDTCLHMACDIKNFECVKLLLEYLSIECTGHKQDTALHNAANSGNTDKVDFLLEEGADPNKANEDGQTNLHYALLKEQLEVVKLFKKNNANINESDKNGQSCLQFSAVSENLSCGKKFECLEGGIDHKNLAGWTALFYAAMKGHFELLNYLLGSSANPLLLDKSGNTCLHIVCESKSLECAKLLLDYLPIDCRNNDQDTPLHWAAKFNAIKIADMLLDRGADPNTKNVYGDPSLHFALFFGNLEITEMLIKKDANVNEKNNNDKSCLHFAAEGGNLRCVEILKSTEEDIVQTNNNGWTALFYAASKGNADVLKYLLGRSADPAHINKKGDTCLHTACESNSLECIKLLLEHLPIDCRGYLQSTPLLYAVSFEFRELTAYLLGRHADPNIKNEQGLTSLQLALMKGNFEIAKLLKEKMANFNEKDNNEKSCLQYAAEGGNLSCIEIFEDITEEGIDHMDCNGWTALFYAAYNGHADVLKYLLARSANPHITCKLGHTCLHIACENNRLECVRLLVEYMPINCRAAKQDTALHYAASEGCKDIVAFLIGIGADPNVRNEDGKTSLHYALGKGHLEIVNLLIEGRANVNEKDEKGLSSLHFAAGGGNVFCVEMFVSAEEGIDHTSNNGWTALFYAASYGHFDVLKYLLGRSADPAHKNKKRDTCLHTACESNSLECVKLLLEHLPIDCRGNLQCTPLLYAVSFGFRELTAYLLGRHADPNIRNEEGLTSLQSALRKGNFEIAKLLKENMANFNEKDNNEKSCLQYAAEGGNLRCIDIFEDITEEGIDHMDCNGWTALFYAAFNGHADVLKYLLARSANPQITCNSGHTCLHVACETNKLECVKLLVEYMPINCRAAKQDTALHTAACSGFSDIVSFLLEIGADPNIKNEDGQTSLHYALARGNLEVVNLLIESSANVNEKDKNGLSSLHYAAEGGNVSCVKKVECLEGGINHTSNNGRTALFCAASIGHLDVLKYLLDKSANPALTNSLGSTCLHIACETNKLECVQVLVRHLQIDITNNKQETPLHKAVSQGSNEIAAFLLESGADPNVKNEHGQTCLHNAIVEKHIDMVKLLKENNANINEKDKNGRTCLHYASAAGNLEFVEIFELKEGDIDISDNNGRTGLFCAAYFGHADVLKYLLERSANPRLKTKRGVTILHAASRSKSVECVQLLVEHVPIESRDADQDTPLNWAAETGCHEIAAFLLTRGADPNVANEEGKSSLHHAAEGGHLETVKVLVENNADINAKTKAGETPLAIAERLGKEDVAEYLRDLIPYS